MNTKFEKITTIIMLVLLGLLVGVFVYKNLIDTDKEEKDQARADQDRAFDLKERELDLYEALHNEHKPGTIPAKINEDKPAETVEEVK